MSRKTRRKVNAKRHPGGSIVRTGPAVERETKAVAEEARMRHYGLSKTDAARPEAATAIGRLLLAREITSTQHEAAIRYLEIVQAYLRAIGAPGELGSAGDLERGGGYDGRDGEDPEYVERCTMARRAWRLARRELLDLQMATGKHELVYALDTWVVANEESWSTLGDLRLALNALVRLWKVPEQRAA